MDKRIEHAAKISVGWIALKAITETMTMFLQHFKDDGDNRMLDLLGGASNLVADVMMDLMGNMTPEELMEVEELVNEYALYDETVDELDFGDIDGFNPGNILNDILGGMP